MSRQAQKAAEVSGLVRAKQSLIVIVTQEEARVRRALRDIATANTMDVRTWCVATGITDIAGKTINASGDPYAMLSAIRDEKVRALWILCDLHKFMNDPIVNRSVRSLAMTLPSATRMEARTMVLIQPTADLPPELIGHAVVIPWPLPDREEITQIHDSCVAGLPAELAATVTADKRERNIDAAIGLNGEDASTAFALSVVTLRTIDPKSVGEAKKRALAREKFDLFEPDPRGLGAVAGLDGLKSWLVERRGAFTQRARDFGIMPPKGIMVAGVTGCGKSLMAKAIGTEWGMPILRGDLGSFKSKFVGEGEANIRRFLAVAEAMAPCIILLDEIEKMMAGATSGGADGGVSMDQVGALLTWMQECKAPVFVIATSNDVSSLPPEFMRKGRFDEIFWVDLPTTVERVAILETTLAQYKRTADGIDLAAVAAVSKGFAGAEVAELVKSALYPAFADGERAIRTGDLLDAASRTVPIAKTATEKLEAQRKWAAGRARPASAPEVATVATVGGRNIDLS